MDGFDSSLSELIVLLILLDREREFRFHHFRFTPSFLSSGRSSFLGLKIAMKAPGKAEPSSGRLLCTAGGSLDSVPVPELPEPEQQPEQPIEVAERRAKIKQT